SHGIHRIPVSPSTPGLQGLFPGNSSLFLDGESFSSRPVALGVRDAFHNVGPFSNQGPTFARFTLHAVPGTVAGVRILTANPLAFRLAVYFHSAADPGQAASHGMGLLLEGDQLAFGARGVGWMRQNWQGQFPDRPPGDGAPVYARTDPVRPD